MKGVKRFGMKGKLAPCLIGHFPILEKCGLAAYKLELLSSLAGVHDIFHMLQLKKCLKAPCGHSTVGSDTPRSGFDLS
jgi:hypothetical protein